MASGVRNLRSFRAGLRDFGRESSELAQLEAKRIAFRLYTRVIQYTPVDTGLLRASWRIGADSVPRGPTVVEGSVGTAAAGQASASASAQGITTAGSWYIANHLAYAAPVEFGRNGRPGARMASRAIDDIDLQIRTGTA